MRNIAFFALRPPTFNAFGFTVFGFGDEGEPDTLRLVLRNVGATIADLPLVSSTDSFEAFRFFGVTSTTPFDNVIIRQSTPDDFITVDAVHVGNIPEPAAVWLFGAAFGCIAIFKASRSRRIL